MKMFNINDFIYIQIKDNGWSYINDTCTVSYIKTCIESNKKKINGEDWYRLQIWQVFQLLPLNHGRQPMFRTNIIIENKYLKTAV